MILNTPKDLPIVVTKYVKGDLLKNPSNFIKKQHVKTTDYGKC